MTRREWHRAPTSDDVAAWVREATDLIAAGRARNGPAALGRAIVLLRQAIAATPAHDPGRGDMLAKTFAAAKVRSDQMTTAEFVEEAIDAGREAVAAQPIGAPRRTACLLMLLDTLHNKAWPLTGGRHLDETIEVARATTEVMPKRLPDYVTCLQMLSEALRRRYDRDGDRADLDAAITQARAAVAAASPDDPTQLASYLSDLGLALVSRARGGSAEQDIDEAIAVDRAALKATPTDDRFRAGRLSNLASSLHTRFTLFDDGAALDESIIVSRAAVAAARAGDPGYPMILGVLAAILLSNAKRTGGPVHLDEAIAVARNAMAVGREHHPASFLSDVSLALSERFERSDAAAELDEAINLGRAAVDACASGDDSRPKYLANLAVSLLARYDRRSDGHDLDEAVEAARAACSAAPADHPNLHSYRYTLGSSLASRFERSGAVADLRESIAAQRSALARIPDEHSDRNNRSLDLCVALLHQYNITGESRDLDEALHLAQVALPSLPRDHPGFARMLSNLGTALTTRYERDGAVADIEQAITYLQNAVAATPPHHPDRAGTLSNLNASVMTHASAKTVEGADLDDAVAVARDAAATADPADRAVILSNLANTLHARYVRTGATADLDGAIDAGRTSVALAAVEHDDRLAMLANLAMALHTRYKRAGDSADLDEAIDLGRAASSATQDPMARAGYLSNLAVALSDRFDLAQAQADLGDAIVAARDAVRVAPPHFHQRAGLINNLGLALSARAQLTQDAADVKEAIAVGRAALDAMPAPHRERPGSLTNLAHMIEASGDVAGLDQAIELHQQALAEVPPYDPYRASILANLGTAMWTRFERTGQSEDRATALDAFRRGAETTIAAPVVRAYCGRRWSDAAATSEDWETSLRATEFVLDLLPQLADHSLSTRDRLVVLERVRGIGSAAAAAHLSRFEATSQDRQRYIGGAWTALEAGRGVMLAQALELRSDIDELRDIDPDLAREVERVRAILNDAAASARSESPSTLSASHEDAASSDRRRDGENRRTANVEWVDLLQRIRARPEPGLDRFGLPPTVQQMQDTASAGTIVAVNITGHRCDAMFLGGHEPGYLRLPELTHDSLVDQVERFLAAVYSDDGGGHPATTMLDVLAWLWEVVAGPILDHLGHRSLPQGPVVSWPRIWWIPTGLLSLLPLHAAGRHVEDPHLAMLDRVVSSYAPTVRSLHRAQQERRAANRDAALIVGVDTYRDLTVAPLRFAEFEANAISDLLGAQPALLGASATRDAVVAALPDARWAHFSCHGTADQDDPSASHLALHDGVLSVRELGALNLPDAYLAYLSACTTATNSGRLPDEPIHVASAFQLAGFTHTVATLWPISDRLSPEIAWRIYERIVDDVPPAAAVHAAVMSMRDDFGDEPRHWASHIHLGP